MLDITIQLNILTRLTPQITTIICHHMKKILLKKIQKDGTTYFKKNKHIFIKFFFTHIILFI